MTNSKLSNSDSAYSIRLVKFMKIVHFLDIYHIYKDLQHLSIDF